METSIVTTKGQLPGNDAGSVRNAIATDTLPPFSHTCGHALRAWVRNRSGATDPCEGGYKLQRHEFKLPFRW